MQSLSYISVSGDVEEPDAELKTTSKRLMTICDKLFAAATLMHLQGIPIDGQADCSH
jgi:hypothetical protein